VFATADDSRVLYALDQATGAILWTLAMEDKSDASPSVVSEGLLRAPGRNRTSDTRFRKPLLYPLSYEGRGPPSKFIRSGQRSIGVQRIVWTVTFPGIPLSSTSRESVARSAMAPSSDVAVATISPGPARLPTRAA
jgi:hypothetical protein